MGNFISRAYQSAKNYVLPKMTDRASATSAVNPYMLPFTARNAKLAQYYIMPLQLQRMAHDISLWRDAVTQAENALYPERYYMQRMYADVILEGHVFACMKKRKSLTMLKDFVIRDQAGKANEDLTKIFKDKQWFNNLLNYILDAQFYGYSLIQLGDLQIEGKNYNFPQLTNIRRWNVSPDRQNLVSIPMQKTGVNFLDPSFVDDAGNSYFDWTVYVDTPTDVGHSICGYGLLYNVALYSIILKNNLSNNSDYTQMFAMPYRHVKTPMTLDENVKESLEKSLQNMGATGYVITPDSIDIEFIESNSGSGYLSYDNLEQRCEKKISKILLGHADALDSTAGKLGSGQGNEPDDSPIGQAIMEVEKEQDLFLLNVLNDTVLPKFRKMGIRIPEGFVFGVTRDKEEIEARKQEDDINLVTANIAQTMKNAGLKMDAKYFEERTKIKTTEVEEPEPMEKPIDKGKPIKAIAGVSDQVRNRLDKIYGNGYHKHEKIN